MGGTWDLFRYPGVRSDSDMYTLGYRFRPWRDAKAIADGPASSTTFARRPLSLEWTKRFATTTA
jgi:cation diffusion facilitator CzcD-associated flavoprotein CzcO